MHMTGMVILLGCKFSATPFVGSGLLLFLVRLTRTIIDLLLSRISVVV